MESRNICLYFPFKCLLPIYAARIFQSNRPLVPIYFKFQCLTQSFNGQHKSQWFPGLFDIDHTLEQKTESRPRSRSRQRAKSAGRHKTKGSMKQKGLSLSSKHQWINLCMSLRTNVCFLFLPGQYENLLMFR